MAEEESDLTHRRLAIPKELWNQVLKLSTSTGVHYQDLVLQLLQDGLRVRAWEASKFGSISLEKKTISPLTQVILEVDGAQLGITKLPSVPAAEEPITWKGKVYTVQERAWALGKKESVAYLRLAEWVKNASG